MNMSQAIHAFPHLHLVQASDDGLHQWPESTDDLPGRVRASVFAATAATACAAPTEVAAAAATATAAATVATAATAATAARRRCSVTRLRMIGATPSVSSHRPPTVGTIASIVAISTASTRFALVISERITSLVANDWPSTSAYIANSASSVWIALAVV